MRVEGQRIEAQESLEFADATHSEVMAISERVSPLVSTAPSHSVMRPRVAFANRARVALLSGVAGYVDAVGFLTLFGLFPAHITGELVGAAVALSAGGLRKNAARFAIVPIFMLGVVLATLVSRALRKRGSDSLGALLALMAIALWGFSASGFLPARAHDGATLELGVRACSAVGAMAFQNVIMREVLTTSCPTSMMTGNLTQVLIELVERFLASVAAGEEDPLVRSRSEARLRLVATALASFVGSAALGGFLTVQFGGISVALPAVLASALAFREIRLRGLLGAVPTSVWSRNSRSRWRASIPVIANPASAEDASHDEPTSTGSASHGCS